MTTTVIANTGETLPSILHINALNPQKNLQDKIIVLISQRKKAEAWRSYITCSRSYKQLQEEPGFEPMHLGSRLCCGCLLNYFTIVL